MLSPNLNLKFYSVQEKVYVKLFTKISLIKRSILTPSRELQYILSGQSSEAFELGLPSSAAFISFDCSVEKEADG